MTTLPPAARRQIARLLAMVFASALAVSAYADRWFIQGSPPVELEITGTLAEGSIHQSATQTLTFTFGETVAGFDASDVTVTGATKGAFASVSGSVYTLEVAGTGGTLTASVPFGAAQSVADNRNTLGDSFSNFYQDTWSLDLPGSVPMELIRIPAGTFTMGSPETELSRNSNETEHEVTITHDFYLSKTEVTQAQWLAIGGSFPQGQQHGTNAKLAVHRISYDDIQSWLTALNTEMDGPGEFSLPTESQWEYAARAGTTTRFNFGNGFSTDENCALGGNREDNMWYCGNSSSSTQLVGQKLANAWGLRDMHGNLLEWCTDLMGAYPAGPVTDPTGAGSGTIRVLRGGAVNNNASSCRSAQRASSESNTRSNRFGFRVLAARPLPLTITSSETQPVHNTETQTLTFTFLEPVTEFEASDVTVTNATKGSFTEVSPAVYTLEISAVANGIVTASVAANAAVESSDFYIGTKGATLSNTYDIVAPTVLLTAPADSAVIFALPSIVVTFSEPVTNLTAGQLTVDGSPATTVTGMNPYTFSGFTASGLGAGLGPISISLAPGSTTDAVGNPFGGDSWEYLNELLEFVSVPAGTFIMGRSDVGLDATNGFDDELPNHPVMLSAYDIGKFEVTNAEYATVMNWALAQGYLANDTAGAAYAGAGNIYLMAQDSAATRQLLFDTITGNAGSQLEWTGSAFAPRNRDSQSMADHPILYVSWYGAVAFCNFLAEMEGKPLAYNASTWELVDLDPVATGLQYVASYRLPTESEWERAAGWTQDLTTRYVFGFSSNDLSGRLCNLDNGNPVNLLSRPYTSPVGFYNGVSTFPPSHSTLTSDGPSPVGCYDMSGNAFEWVHDWYDSYTDSAKTNPTGPSSGTDRVTRGGSWDIKGVGVRTALRFFTEVPGFRSERIGFRVAAVR